MFPRLITAEVECRDWLVTLEVTHELMAVSMEHVQCILITLMSAKWLRLMKWWQVV